MLEKSEKEREAIAVEKAEKETNSEKRESIVFVEIFERVEREKER